MLLHSGVPRDNKVKFNLNKIDFQNNIGLLFLGSMANITKAFISKLLFLDEVMSLIYLT